ncbi:hypothetical protein [Nocardioides flavescens]|uniref:Uncharacterized protein n=1 Tax=Nocardioides flavescens TaxID=2691959 RepID=A0A6L7EZG6_9ACTN|nr:hypothetical protein [Nocardioides flavescens]MXG89729.1 hypothetical protein [Nocardioides flavescens]
MVDRFVVVVSVGLLLAAGLLVGGGATVSYGGETRACAGPIVAAESGGPVPPASTDTERGLQRACAASDGTRARVALLLALVGAGVGSTAVVRPGRRTAVFS